MNPRRIAASLWREWIRPLALPLLCIASAKSAVGDINYVPSGSMHPTLLEGDVVWVNKLAYDLRVPFTFTRLARWDDPARGDIVVCFSPTDDTRLVKRVVGIPGDLVAMHDNVLSVNGEALRYEPLPASVGHALEAAEQAGAVFAEEHLGDGSHVVMSTPRRSAPRSFPATRVPDGSYLVLGDNRDNSGDSRFFGFMPREKIIGRVPRVVVSADLNRGLKPRFDRTFSRLH